MEKFNNYYNNLIPEIKVITHDKLYYENTEGTGIEDKLSSLTLPEYNSNQLIIEFIEKIPIETDSEIIIPKKDESTTEELVTE